MMTLLSQILDSRTFVAERGFTHSIISLQSPCFLPPQGTGVCVTSRESLFHSGPQIPQLQSKGTGLYPGFPHVLSNGAISPSGILHCTLVCGPFLRMLPTLTAASLPGWVGPVCPTQSQTEPSLRP